MDIRIVSGRLGKSVVTALTEAGRHWLIENMTGSAPITIDTEAEREIIELCEQQGLSVERK